MTTENQNQRVDMKLEVIIIPVFDVDRAKAFYEKLGWRLDGDFVINQKLRGVQVTPPHSGASIIFGKGLTPANAGPITGLVLAVDDIDAARAELISGGANVSELFHYVDFPFNHSVDNPRIPGRDPQGRTYFTFASFDDPDGNGWLLQEITTRLPGREWKATEERSMGIAPLAELLHETEQHHGAYEKTHAKHNWWDWYAGYFSARQNGSTSEEATAAADRYMTDVLQIKPL